MKSQLKLAVVGVGMMAHIRTRAFLETKKIQLVGVASRNADRAKQFAAQWGCGFSTDNYPELKHCRPDIILAAVPHRAQSQIVKWALEQKHHILIGSCMAMNTRELNRIRAQAKAHNLVVEGGFEARYKPVWKQAKQLIQSGKIGEICAVQATACWGANPDSWYYAQEESGGMPITHMTYAFLNPLTWIFGMPRNITARANAKGVQKPGMVKEVTCIASLEYDNQVLCNLLASYIHHPQAPDWRLYIHGAHGALEVLPGEFGAGELLHYAGGPEPQHMRFENAPDPFALQAETFIQAVNGGDNQLQNTPAQGAEDVQIASAIVKSIQKGKNIALDTSRR
ncbi:MAG: Gfo/Idh/MocA family oxidoreductase [Sulfuricellaceae bacterium]